MDNVISHGTTDRIKSTCFMAMELSKAKGLVGMLTPLSDKISLRSIPCGAVQSLIVPMTRGHGIMNRSKAKSKNAGKRGPTHYFPAKSNTISRPLLLISQAVPHSSRTTTFALTAKAAADQDRPTPCTRDSKFMPIDKQAYIVGAWEHPTRKAPDKSVVQLHAECAAGALADAGLTKDDIDAYFCAGDAPGLGPLTMIDFLNLRVRHCDSTDIGGSAPLQHVAHAAQAIAAGKCHVALITLAGRPRSGWIDPELNPTQPDQMWELPLRRMTADIYAMCARRHMHEYGTTSDQLAWIKVAASHHAQHNPNAMLRKVVTVEEVLSSPMVSDPLHRLDCCVTSDGGGAVVVTRPEIAKSLKRPRVKVIGAGEAVQGQSAGAVQLTATAARQSGATAFAEAGIQPSDIRYASIYDSFTITVLIALEDLGFCEKGKGGCFVADGNLISGVGHLPFNTDGGGLCSSHPARRGGITKVIEAVRQLRGEAHPAVQVKDCGLALAHGTGMLMGTRHSSATLILERE